MPTDLRFELILADLRFELILAEEMARWWGGV